MSDSNKPLNRQDKKRLEHQRGQGSGKAYIPFVQVGEFSGSGESIRVKSSTVGRLHHFHSGIELAAFLIFDRSSNITDIREQFPLPLSSSLTICEQLGIKHPQVKGELYIVSTDLLLDCKNNTSIAIAVKPAAQLNDKRVLEKLQIEKAYWENKGVKWYIFTEYERPSELKMNLQWLRSFLDADTSIDYEISDEDVQTLISRLSNSSTKKITKRCGELDDEYHLSPGFHIEIFRFAIANNFIKADLRQQYINWKVEDLIFVGHEKNKGALGHVS
ncbi:heteromeric transposase endonuclease subunit TnsA [Thalassotalea sp. ND16A]|uniref:heteromeric transposase endonuclease subunit TnsA n=1 Tax=Thalassotalea sp. ND16A TaxID=1535422 RepID=UPI00051A0351|nr:heteromeric transposase endonuclease subunit TnsA [Thalassotalea sp. ND16A]KGJ95989.1 hypothetical protein ND16A_1168 [Thalassotalea sp. ND16A]